MLIAPLSLDSDHCRASSLLGVKSAVCVKPC